MNGPLLAVLAGLLTVAAPCVLPMLPVILGASVGQTSRWRPVFIAAGFALAFSCAALLLGSASQLAGLSEDFLRDAGLAMLLVFGVLMLWRAPFDWLAVRMNGLVNRAHAVGDRAGNGHWGGLLLGLTLGVVWTPCAGPVLGSILTLVATSPDTGHAAFLLLCYSLGAALPMLGIAYGGQVAATRVRQLARHTHRLQQGFGLLVIAIAIATYFQYDTAVTVWLSHLYPQARTGL